MFNSSLDAEDHCLTGASPSFEGQLRGAETRVLLWRQSKMAHVVSDAMISTLMPFAACVHSLTTDTSGEFKCVCDVKFFSTELKQRN